MCFLQHTSSDWHLLKVWINNDAFKNMHHYLKVGKLLGLCWGYFPFIKTASNSEGTRPRQKRKKREIPITTFTMQCYFSWVFSCAILIVPWSLRKLWETHCIREYNYASPHLPALLKRPSAFRVAGELVSVHACSHAQVHMSEWVCMSACVHLWVCLAWMCVFVYISVLFPWVLRH